VGHLCVLSAGVWASECMQVASASLDPGAGCGAGRAAIVGEDAGQMQQQLDQVGGLYAHVPLLRDDHVGLLGQNVPASDDSLARSLSVASADGVPGAGAGRGAAGGGASSAQNSQGPSDLWACPWCGEHVCSCQDLLDSNPTTTCSSVSRYRLISCVSRVPCTGLSPTRSRVCQPVRVCAPLVLLCFSRARDRVPSKAPRVEHKLAHCLCSRA